MALSQVNATACAVPRLLIALLESNQQKVRGQRIAAREAEGSCSSSRLRSALSPGRLGPRATCSPALPRHGSDHGSHPCASQVHWAQPAPEAQAPKTACLELRTHQPPGLLLLLGPQGTLCPWDLLSWDRPDICVPHISSTPGPVDFRFHHSLFPASAESVSDSVVTGGPNVYWEAGHLGT